MKTRKLFNLFAVMGMSSILLFSSCAKEDDTNPDDPTSEDQSKFKGNWTVSEVSTEFGKSTYNATLSDSTNGSHLLIAYLYRFKKKTYATVNGSTMTIPSQIIEGVELSGSGVLENSKRLTLKCRVQITKTKSDSVTFTLTK